MSDELIEGHCDKCGKEIGDDDNLIFTLDNGVDGFRYMCRECRNGITEKLKMETVVKEVESFQDEVVETIREMRCDTFMWGFLSGAVFGIVVTVIVYVEFITR